MLRMEVWFDSIAKIHAFGSRKHVSVDGFIGGSKGITVDNGS